MASPSEKPSTTKEDEKEKPEEKLRKLKKYLEQKIHDLPKDNPTRCEGLIRELHKEVLAVEIDVEIDDVKLRDHLLTELKMVSWRGLSKELKEMMEKNGLALEGLQLVLKYVTTQTELAQYLFVNSKEEIKEDGLDAVRRRLGHKLEVLGGLSSQGIDVTKDWVTKLVKEAPSLQSLARVPVIKLEELCKKATHGEKKEVRRLVKVAESRARKSATMLDDPEKSKEDEKQKAIDEEKLQKARALMDEAKEMAKKESDEAKKAVEKKMAEITKILELPTDWNKQDGEKKPDQLFKQLDEMMKQFENTVEESERYKSDLEVVEKASGGRALCGIYHSEYEPPKTAERPIIVMPTNVTLSSPNNSQQIRYRKFSKSRAAATFVQSVKSSSTNIGFSASGFYEGFVGKVHGSYASSSEEDTTSSTKGTSNSASVVQYIWTATKTFKIDQEQMTLSPSARRMARSIVKNEERDKINLKFETTKDDPEKVKQDCDNANSESEKANSESNKANSEFDEANSESNKAKDEPDGKAKPKPDGKAKCEPDMANCKPGRTKQELEKKKHQLDKEKSEEAVARCFMKRYGSHFPAGLQTLGGVLFRIVDAESRTTKDINTITEKAAQRLQSQISVGFFGGVFGIGASVSAEHSSSSGKTSAQDKEEEDTSYTFSFQAMGPAATNPAAFSKLLANNSTWALIDRGSDDAYIPVWELIRDIGEEDYDKAAQVLENTWRKDEEDKQRKSLRVEYKITDIIKEDLEKRRDECIQKPLKTHYGHWPTNGSQLTFDFPTIELSREQAYTTAMQIILEDPRYRICEIALSAENEYTLRCWKASDKTEMTFQQVEGEHVLFYSERLFKWKAQVPLSGGFIEPP